MLRIKGDFAALRAFAAKARNVDRVFEVVAKNVGEELVELTRERFEQENDPYGDSWEPTQRGGEILRDTGALSAGWHITQAGPRSVTIGPSVSYGTYHQTGTENMPARMMVPENNALPAEYAERIEDIVNLTLKAHFG